jgi:hypothetical protein
MKKILIVGIIVLLLVILITGIFIYLKFPQKEISSNSNQSQNSNNITDSSLSNQIESITVDDIRSEAVSFKGDIQQPTQQDITSTVESDSYVSSDPLFGQYGVYGYQTFKKHPEIVSALKALDPHFDPYSMSTSSPNEIVKFNNHTLMIVGGCYPHNCGYTEQIVAIDTNSHAVYYLRPGNIGPITSQPKSFILYGNPSSEVRAAILQAYPLNSFL